MKKEDDEKPEEGSEEEENNDLSIENELKKIKLSLEHGVDFSMLKNEDLPPELESKWLDYIQQFEDEYTKNKKISVFDYVGRPTVKNVNEIPDADIENALDELLETLDKNNVMIETICDVDDRELYRFITEELFKEETNELRIEGMKNVFIYEEFHPNHEYDIRNHGTDFIYSILDKDKKWMPDFLGLAIEIITPNGNIDHKNIIHKIEDFREAFSEFTLVEFEIKNIEFDKENANLDFTINYTGKIEGSNDSVTNAGAGNLHFIMEYGYWSINKISIPGLIL